MVELAIGGVLGLALLALAAGMLVYGARWMAQRERVFIDAMESREDSAAIERDKLLERIQAPLTSHASSMQDIYGHLAQAEQVPEPEPPDFDLDLAIANAVNDGVGE